MSLKQRGLQPKDLDFRFASGHHSGVKTPARPGTPLRAASLDQVGGYRFGDCEFHPGARRLRVAGREVALGGRALDLLHALVSQQDRVLSKDELYERVWPGVAVEPNNLQVQIWSLRKLLGREAIATVPRRGYRFMLRVVTVAPGAPARGPNGPDSQAHEAAWQVRQHRLVSLVGPDAAATQALADAVLRELAGTWPAGVWQTQARVLAGPCGEVGRAVSASEQLHRLLRRLARGAAVLVVRACHQVPDNAAQAVQAALAAAPQLHVLATGEERLGLAIEHVIRLRPADGGRPGPPAAHAPLSAATRPYPRSAPPASG